MRIRQLATTLCVLPMLFVAAHDLSAMGGQEGTFEYAIDAPWRIEPVVDASANATYGAIPILLIVLDENVIELDPQIIWGASSCSGRSCPPPVRCRCSAEPDRKLLRAGDRAQQWGEPPRVQQLSRDRDDQVPRRPTSRPAPGSATKPHRPTRPASPPPNRAWRSRVRTAPASGTRRPGTLPMPASPRAPTLSSRSRRPSRVRHRSPARAPTPPTFCR